MIKEIIKYIFAGAVIFLPVSVFAFSAGPASQPVADPAHINSACNIGGDVVYLFPTTPTSIAISAYDCADGGHDLFSNAFTGGYYYAVEADNFRPGDETLAQIELEPSFQGKKIFQLTASSNLSALLVDADTNIQANTGLSVPESVSWAGNNLTKPFIGSGLLLLYSLRWWIVALIMIAAGIYFCYRAYKFSNKIDG